MDFMRFHGFPRISGVRGQTSCASLCGRDAAPIETFARSQLAAGWLLAAGCWLGWLAGCWLAAAEEEKDEKEGKEEKKDEEEDGRNSNTLELRGARWVLKYYNLIIE